MEKPRQKINLLILTKSIDAGTGTLVLSLQKLKEKHINLRTLVLEEPSYRRIETKFSYFHGKNYYPYNFRIKLISVLDFMHEVLWYKGENVRFNADIVIGIDLYSNLIVLISKIIFRIKSKIIITTNINLEETLSTKSSQPLRLLLINLIKIFYNRADLLICSASLMKRNLSDRYGIKRKIKVIHYGVREYVKTKQQISSRLKKILSIGRLVEQKGFYTLIDAYSIVNKKYKNTELNIIGDGPLRDDISGYIKENKLDSSIKLLGWRRNTPTWIEKSDIFVLSSRREGFPYVLLEALSVGRPIVSTDAPFGPSEILGKGKYGIIVPVGNVKKLAESIIRLLNNPKERKIYGEKARKRSMFFLENKMISEYAESVHQLVN